MFYRDFITIWGWEFQSATPTVFFRCQPNFLRTLDTMVKYRLLLFLASSQVLKKLWHFEILTWESMGKSKMWNISADCRAKRPKLWDSGYYSTHLQGTFLARLLEFGLGSFDTLLNFRFYCVQNATPAVFITFQPNFIQSIIIRG